jgi:hypothetical protein
VLNFEGEKLNRRGEALNIRSKEQFAEQELRLREEFIREHVIKFNAKLRRETDEIISNHEAQVNEQNERVEKRSRS